MCEALGLQQVRHEVGDVVAGRMQVKKSLIRRIREGKANPIENWSADEKTISIFTAEEVYDLALKGNVLVRGWGATLLLRAGAPHPLRAGVRADGAAREAPHGAPARPTTRSSRATRSRSTTRRAPRAWASTST